MGLRVDDALMEDDVDPVLLALDVWVDGVTPFFLDGEVRRRRGARLLAGRRSVQVDDIILPGCLPPGGLRSPLGARSGRLSRCLGGHDDVVVVVVAVVVVAVVVVAGVVAGVVAVAGAVRFSLFK